MGFWRVNTLVTGDVSGGALTVIWRFDPVYVGVCAWMRCKQSESPVPILMECTLYPTSTANYGFEVANQNAVGGFRSQTMWVPPPVILETNDNQATPPTIQFRKVNVDGETLRCNAEIYLFDKRAREIGQVEDLLAAIGRGGSLFAGDV